ALAAIGAGVSVLALVQARDTARQADQLQRSIVQSIADNAQTQAAALRAVEAGLRELSEREAALVAAIKAAAPPTPHAVAPPQAATAPPPRATVKPAAPPRSAKRSNAAR
ncbi:MAG: hypothetical protein ABIX11_09420, partial [Casimicrobiaceae bacterium]